MDERVTAGGPGGQEDLPGRAEPALALVDRAGRVTYVSDALAAELGVRPGELLGTDVFHLVAEGQRPAARQALRRAERTGRLGRSLWRLSARTGRAVDVSLSPQSLVGGGELRLYVLTAEAPGELPVHTERQALLAAIATECDEAIVTVAPGGVIELWNHAAEDLFGWAEAEAIGCPVSMLVPHEHRQEAEALLERAWAGEVVNRVETVRMCKHGSRVEVSVSFAPLRDGAGRVIGVYQVVRDITQQKASERALAYQALHDHLTGLPNRSLLEDRMAHALERCRREGTSVGLVFFDLDHFKTVNDTAGHEVGDRLLRAVAARLRQSVRSMDTVARLGGDEFVVLCEDIRDDSQLDVIVSHIMRSFAEPVVLPDRQLWVSLSGGVVKGCASSSVAQLLSQADAAMYQAKERSRGTVGRYDPRTRPALERRAEVSRLLRMALEAHQLVPYYQPIFDLHNGAMVSLEALVRWEDPARGVVPAKEFIPLAEELGLAGEIGELVLGEAAARAKQWSRLLPGLKVTVNVSPKQLRGGSLLRSVRSLVAQGLEPGSLTLEVTETAVMEDATAGGSVLQELRDWGFGIAIDDFGTGYSSLAYLKRLPASSIKVDQAFTAQLPDPQDLSVVMAILAIADSYGLEVVAEGIESAEQAEVLKSLGCQHGQGYHFGRPVPASMVDEMLLGGPTLVRAADNGAAHRP